MSTVTAMGLGTDNLVVFCLVFFSLRSLILCVSNGSLHPSCTTPSVLPFREIITVITNSIFCYRNNYSIPNSSFWFLWGIHHGAKVNCEGMRSLIKMHGSFWNWWASFKIKKKWSKSNLHVIAGKFTQSGFLYWAMLEARECMYMVRFLSIPGWIVLPWPDIPSSMLWTWY